MEQLQEVTVVVSSEGIVIVKRLLPQWTARWIPGLILGINEDLEVRHFQVIQIF